jgi:ABC-type glycerol-3-phosphate transport system substrate-binding protein
MKRKILFDLTIWFLFISMAFLLGCCDKEASDLRVNESFTVLPVPEEDFLGDIQNTEITFIYTPNPSIDLRFNADFKEVVTKVTDLVYEKYKIKVNMEFIANQNYYDTVSVRLKSNDRIDVFSPYPSKYPNMETVPYSTQNYLQQWIHEFEVADLTDYINAYYPELKETLSDPDIRETTEYNGRIYGVPGISSYMQGNLQVLAVYKEYYEHVERPEIHTIDDLYRLIRAVEDSPYMNKGRILCSFEDFLTWHLGNNGYVYFINLFAYQGKTLLSLENEPLFHEAFNLYKEISHLISEDDMPFHWQQYWQVPGDQDIREISDPYSSPVLIQVATYDQFNIQQIRDTERFSDEYEFFFLNTPYTITYDLYTLNYLINGGSSHINTALFFVKCLQTDQNIYDLLRYGIKDKHYSLNDEGVLSIKDSVFTGWDLTDRLISRPLERPISLELLSLKTVWEDYIHKPRRVIDGIDYKKLLRIRTGNEDIDRDLLRIFNNRAPGNLFKELFEGKSVRSLTEVIKSGIELDEFIRYYETNDTNVLLKELQAVIDKTVE